MRALLLATLLATSAAQAQNISGTLTGSFKSFNEYGQPTVTVDLELMCTLTCTPSAPTLGYGVTGGVGAHLVEAPSEGTGYLSSGFGSDPSGSNVVDSIQFEPGTAFILTATSASCYCGNAFGEGGYVDINSSAVVVPPYVFVGTGSGPPAGYEYTQMINARLRGTETISVHLSGAGVETTQTLTAADYTNNNTIGTVTVTPTMAGPLEVTATFEPYHVTHTNTVMVTAGNGGATGGGAGGGGGSSGTGGGGAGGGGTQQGGGCSAFSGQLGFILALLTLARVRRQ